MIALKLAYTVSPEFVERNKKNIGTFLADFKVMLTSEFLYHVYVKEDGLTFVHVGMFENETIQQQVLATPSYVAYKKEREESGHTGPTDFEILDHIGSSLSLIK